MGLQKKNREKGGEKKIEPLSQMEKGVVGVDPHKGKKGWKKNTTRWKSKNKNSIKRSTFSM